MTWIQLSEKQDGIRNWRMKQYPLLGHLLLLNCPNLMKFNLSVIRNPRA